MSIILKKIWHRDAFWIGIYFPYDSGVISKLKSLDAHYSKTHTCWYIDYDPVSYAKLKDQFDNLIIELPANSEIKTSYPVAGDLESRDLPPIATSEHQSGFDIQNNPEHKTELSSFANKMRIELLENVGKYWVFKMHYHQTVSKELLGTKGVFWNSNYKVYMVLRHPKVKQEVIDIPTGMGFAVMGI